MTTEPGGAVQAAGGYPPGGGGYGPPPGGGGYGPPPGGGGYGPPPGGGGYGPPPGGGFAPPQAPGGFVPPAYTPPAFAPPAAGHGTQGPPQGLKIASLILLILGACAFVAGLFPCLGWMNWGGVPLNAIVAIVGIIGLAAGPKDARGQAVGFGIHLTAIIVGAVGVLGGSLRCFLGSGML